MSELYKMYDLDKDFKMISEDLQLGVIKFNLTEILCCIRQACQVGTQNTDGTEDVSALIEKAFIFNLGVLQGKKKETKNERV